MMIEDDGGELADVELLAQSAATTEGSLPRPVARLLGMAERSCLKRYTWALITSVDRGR